MNITSIILKDDRMLFTLKSFFCLVLFSLSLQGCNIRVVKQVSFPTLKNAEKKSNKIHKLRNLDWILKIEDIEFYVDVKNYKTLETTDSVLFIPVSKSGIRAPNINKSPFILDIGIRAERSDYVLNVSNVILSMKKENKQIKPTAIYVAHVGEEFVDCLRNRTYNLILPLANTETLITRDPAKPDSSKHWKCIRYVFDIPTPDPKNSFSLFLGQIKTQDSFSTTKNVIVDFDPLYYESERSH